MSSGSEYNSSSPRRDHHRQDSSRSRSRERKDKELRERQRERKIKVKVPELSTSLLSFRNFCHLQTEKLSSEHLQRCYDRYKKDWEQRQSQQFIKQYKKDAWFSQKYDPQVLDLLDRERKQNCKKLHQEFMEKFNHGFFDKINLTITEPNDLGQVDSRSQEQQEQNNTFSHLVHQTIEVHVQNQNDIHLAPFFAFDQDLNTLFIKSVPRSISKYDIRSVVEKLEGYRSITMSEPVKKFNLIRYCWIEFDNQQHTNKAALSLSGLMIKNQTLVVSKSSTKSKRIKVLKNYPRSRIDKDLDTITRLIQTLDKQVGIEDNQLIKKEFTSNSTKMDVFLVYLRKVHAYDYYAGAGFENQRLLALKVSSAFLKVQADYEQLENVQTVFKKIQERAQERIEKMNVSRDYMGMLRQQIELYIRESEKLDKDAVKQVWKCHFCDKKFKTCEFLAKHIISKHEDIKFKKIQVIMQKLYAQDPQRITFLAFREQNERFKKPFTSGYRRERKSYRDFDEPEQEKGTSKPVVAGGKAMVNFLDI